jgi:hypothetical protein
LDLRCFEGDFGPSAPFLELLGRGFTISVNDASPKNTPEKIIMSAP